MLPCRGAGQESESKHGEAQGSQHPSDERRRESNPYLSSRLQQHGGRGQVARCAGLASPDPEGASTFAIAATLTRMAYCLEPDSSPSSGGAGGFACLFEGHPPPAVSVYLHQEFF